MQEKKSKKSFVQAIRFGVVGVFNTLVDYGVFYVLLSFLHLNKGMAQVLATGTAMCGSFFINRYWTFEKHGRGNLSEIIKFLVINFFAMLTVIGLTYLFYDVLHAERAGNALFLSLGFSFVLRGNMAVMFCKVLASVFSVMINFLGNKFWVFKN